MVNRVSKYGHIVMGKSSPYYLNDKLTLEAVNKLYPHIKTSIIDNGRKILDLLLPYEKHALPKIMLGDDLLRKLEEAAHPYNVIPVREIRDFIYDYSNRSSHDPSIKDFLKKYDLTMKQTFDQAKPQSGKLMILSGPSGVGKEALQEYLLKDGLPKFVLHNIRDRRPGEWNGVTYYFISGQDKIVRCNSLVEMKNKDLFIATALVHEKALFNDDGTLIIPGARSQGVGKNLFEMVDQGKDLFAEVGLKLAAQIIMRARLKDLKVNYVFLLPSSFDELINRIVGRALKDVGGDIDKLLTKAKIKLINERLEDGIGEMAFSFLLHPAYVVNSQNRIKESAEKLRTAFKFVPYVSSVVGHLTKDDISGKVTVNDYDKAIQKAQEDYKEGLELLPPNYPIVNQIPAEAAKILQDKIVKLTANGTVKAEAPSLLDVMRDKDFMNLVWKACGCPYLFNLTDQIHPGIKQKYTVGIQPGTMSPYHFGYISCAQAGILDAGLAGVFVLSGSNPPENKFVIAANHREHMVKLGLVHTPYLHYSPIRGQMMDALSNVVLGGSENKRLIEASKEILASENTEEKKKLQIALDEERRLKDLAAFSFLISMNPHLKWEYVVGVDKVNEYGISDKGKNERDLVMDLLIANNIPIRYYTRAGEDFKLFETEKDYVDSHPNAKSWVLQNKEKIDNSLYEGATLIFDISDKTVGKMIEKNEPLLDVLPSEIIGYIYDHNLTSAYILEHKAIILAKQLKGGRIKEDDAAKILNQINTEREALFAAGILANGDRLNIDDVRNLQ